MIHIIALLLFFDILVFTSKNMDNPKNPRRHPTLVPKTHTHKRKKHSPLQKKTREELLKAQEKKLASKEEEQPKATTTKRTDYQKKESKSNDGKRINKATEQDHGYSKISEDKQVRKRKTR